MKYITGEDRYQIAFLPDCIEDYVSKDNPVRVVDAFVNQLDMDKLRLNGITSDTMSYAGGKKKSQRNWGYVFLPITCEGQSIWWEYIN